MRLCVCPFFWGASWYLFYIRDKRCTNDIFMSGQIIADTYMHADVVNEPANTAYSYVRTASLT